MRGIVKSEGTTDVVVIAKPGGLNTGVGRYVHMLMSELCLRGYNSLRIPPSVPPLPSLAYTGLAKLRIDARSFLSNYPIWADYPKSGTYHLSSQNLATLLMFRPPKGKTIVTVHDIIPFMLRNVRDLNPYGGRVDRWFDRLAMEGLKRADRLIADSHYTKRCLIEHLGLPETLIDVVHLGIDHLRFRPQAVSREIRGRYGLAADRRYLIYVGSEDPRKNLEAQLNALALVRQEHDDVEFIKVGAAHFKDERARLLQLVEKLGIRSAVHFLDDVPEQDLPLLYCLADVCVMTSLYEGFGFPVLEAMACGTPVVCSNGASLPELAGTSALLFDPLRDGSAGLAYQISRLLRDQNLQRELRSQGRKQAAKFTWSSTAERTIEIYQNASAVPVTQHVESSVLRSNR
jgi:glycosyltransferase involved in cell wall biosynthesis